MTVSSIGWHNFISERQYPSYKWMELNRSADYLCREILEITKGENVLIYADTASDPRVVQATSAAAHTLGAEVCNIWYRTKQETDAPPPKAVQAAVLASDMVISFVAAYICHGELWYQARVENKIPMKCLAGLTADSMVRTIDPDTHPKIVEMEETFSKIIMEAEEGGRITNRSGTDFTFKLAKGAAREAYEKGYGMDKEGGQFSRGGMLGGQVDLFVDPKTINGTIAFDGCLWPPAEVGAIKEPIVFKIKDGMSQVVSDHPQARIMKNWFAHFNTPEAYEMIHVDPGFNPGVKRISGDIVEDERYFGCIECGIGVYRPEIPCHTDGIIIDTSLWLDDQLIEDNGIYVEPRLKKLAKELGMQQWVD